MTSHSNVRKIKHYLTNSRSVDFELFWRVTGVNLINKIYAFCKFSRREINSVFSSAPKKPTPTLGCFVRCCFVNLQSQTQLSVCQTWHEHCRWCLLWDHLIAWQANGLWCYCCFVRHTLWDIILLFIIVPIWRVDGDLHCLLLVRMAGNYLCLAKVSQAFFRCRHQKPQDYFP